MELLTETKKYPKVFVVVLLYNGKEFIKNCLSSVYKINYPNLEVVVVDNNSQDGSAEIVRSFFPRAHLIKNAQNIGFSAGNNLGIKFALEHMADYVFLLNQDTEVASDLLEKLVRAGENNVKLGIVSPLVYWGNENKIWFSGGKINWRRMKTSHERKKITQPNFKTDFISGCSMMVKKEVFQKIGLLDEDFFLYWEDADFSWRAKKAGWQMAVIPEVSIKHFEKSSEPSGNKIYWLVISGLIFFQKNSCGLRRAWIKVYCFFRRMKNLADLKKGKTDAFYVRKAYIDFQKTCQTAK